MNVIKVQSIYQSVVHENIPMTYNQLIKTCNWSCQSYVFSILYICTHQIVVSTRLQLKKIRKIIWTTFLNHYLMEIPCSITCVKWNDICYQLPHQKQISGKTSWTSPLLKNGIDIRKKLEIYFFKSCRLIFIFIFLFNRQLDFNLV